MRTAAQRAKTLRAARLRGRKLQTGEPPVFIETFSLETCFKKASRGAGLLTYGGLSRAVFPEIPVTGRAVLLAAYSCGAVADSHRLPKRSSRNSYLYST